MSRSPVQSDANGKAVFRSTRRRLHFVVPVGNQPIFVRPHVEILYRTSQVNTPVFVYPIPAYTPRRPGSSGEVNTLEHPLTRNSRVFPAGHDLLCRFEVVRNSSRNLRPGRHEAAEFINQQNKAVNVA